MCKEMPVIPVNEDKKRIIGKRRAEEEMHKGSLTHQKNRISFLHVVPFLFQ
jgi:hypothetical protein